MAGIIRVPRLTVRAASSTEAWSRMMDSITRHPLDYRPWPDFVHGPATHFSIAHTNTAILLKYYVDEDIPRVTCFNPNEPVYKDSCVEFFISFDGGHAYYNMEWNAVGTCLMAHGAARNDRVFLPARLIRAIQVDMERPSLPAKPGWTLFLYIPREIFIHNSPLSLSGIHATANFYKCGDECPHPHYLAWNDIPTPSPDFHQPRYFGDLLFL